jgi:hypothetical protein
MCITLVIYQESLHDARSTKCKNSSTYNFYLYMLNFLLSCLSLHTLLILLLISIILIIVLYFFCCFYFSSFFYLRLLFTTRASPTGYTTVYLQKLYKLIPFCQFALSISQFLDGTFWSVSEF